MKNRNSKLIFITICFTLIFVWLLLFSGQVKADSSVAIRLQIKTYDATLYDQDITVTACPEADGSATSTINARCAVDQTGLTEPSDWAYGGTFLNSIGGAYASDYVNNIYWGWFSNLQYGDVALTQHILINGEKLLLTYGINPLKISIDNTMPFVNATSTITVQQFGLDLNWNPIWPPAASSTFIVNGQEVASSTDAYQLWTSTTTPYVVMAKKAGFLDSDSITITPQLPTINIKLRIETASSTLFNQNLNVSACEENTDSGIYSLNSRCALEQSGLQTQWTNWGSDSFLDSINTYLNNQDGNGIYWLWFSNLDLGQTALNKHILSNNEELLLVYGINPLRITTATTTPYINSTSTLLIEQFGLDLNWSPVWEPAASSTFLIDNQEIFSADGTFQLFISTSSLYSVWGRKAGYLDSPILILNGVLQNSTSTEPASTSTPPNPPNSGSGSADSHQSVNIGSAINFLIINQNNDGLVGSSVLYSDWAAIALAAYGDSEAKNKLKNYLAGAESNIEFGLPITNLERRAMALMALGINPYNGTKTDYIAHIVSAFDGNQIGDPNIFNDDIFALFPLLKAGYSGSDPIIDATIRFIISKQNTNGSWDSVDLTAAAVQALVLAQKTGNLSGDLGDFINQSLLAAKNFLRNSQGVNGGFNNNSFSTSWVIQAIAALGESVSSWENSGKNPIDFLASYQKNDGGFENESTAADTRIWATTYAIPAALNKTWGDILNNFPKSTPSLPVANNSSEGYSAVLPPDDNIATSTPNIATSTPTVENTTSTPISALPEKTAASSSVIQSQSQNNNIYPAAIPPPPTEQKNPEIIQTPLPLPLEAQITASPISENLLIENTARIIFYLSTIIVISLGLYLVLKFFFAL